MPRLSILALLVLLLAPAPSARAEVGERPNTPLRMNQIQVIGTHNSYHLRPKILGIAKMVTRETEDWDYAHPPLDQQLEHGVRSFELDLHPMSEGWEVFHLPVIDAETNCRKFTDCLETVRAWSRAHPRHVPISFLLELKDEGRLVDSRIPKPDAAWLARLDADIRSVFDENHLLTPDDVRGQHPTLEEAILKDGWPLLDDVRGKVFFILHEQNDLRDLYTEGRPALEGRAMFIRSAPGRPDAATIIRDNPSADDVEDLVRKGYWVRSTADGRQRAGEPPNTARSEKALAVGAHIVTTDHTAATPHANGFKVSLPGGGVARGNPINAPHTDPISE